MFKSIIKFHFYNCTTERNKCTTGDIKSHGEGKQKCPTRNQMLPCKCRDKKNGLDIVCEKVTIDQLMGVTSTLKKHNQGGKLEYNVGVRSASLVEL